MHATGDPFKTVAPGRLGGRRFAIVIRGELACFTRPEMKVERVSYPTLTPSAARGILESVFWKPQFHWAIREIWTLRPVRWISVFRNEVKNKIPLWLPPVGHNYDAVTDHTRRHTLALRDVSYLVQAEMMLVTADKSQEAQFRDQFRRCLSRGACFQHPYLGCREFAAFFAAPAGNENPIDWNEDLGLMLLDFRYGIGTRQTLPVFFPARVRNGVLSIPSFCDESLRRHHAA